MAQLRKKFKVTHPFHPRYNNEYELLSYRRSWGSEHLEFIDENNQSRSIPLVWTDAADIDPFIEMSRGRCAFRVTDLLRLCDLVDDLGS